MRIGNVLENKDIPESKYSKGKKYMEITVVMRSEIDNEFAEQLRMDISRMPEYCDEISKDIKGIIGDVVSSDIVSVSTSFNL